MNVAVASVRRKLVPDQSRTRQYGSVTLRQYAIVHSIADEILPDLRRYAARWVNSPEDVDDVMQDVFVKIIGYRQISSIKSVKAFAFVTTANLLKDRYRSSYYKERKNLTPINESNVGTDVTNPVRILENREKLTMVFASLKKLNPNARRAFLLHRLAGLSHSEIAEKMQVSTSMVEKHIMEALKRIRQTVQI